LKIKAGASLKEAFNSFLDSFIEGKLNSLRQPGGLGDTGKDTADQEHY
jgi:hypothetical protein